jgi:hypothetical protein
VLFAFVPVRFSKAGTYVEAESWDPGLAKIPIETATSTSTDHNLKDFNMYKFYMLKKNPLAKNCQGKLG